MRFLCTIHVAEPGESLARAVALADALDTRRVGVTLLVGPRPHPEVASWVRARRRVGDAVLLHGTGPGSASEARLPGHEARLRLTATGRTLDAHGVVVDGFAAPDGAVSDGVRRALVAAGHDLLLDDAGVHRLDASGEPSDSCRSEAAAGPAARLTALAPRRRRRPGGPVDLLVVDAVVAVDTALAAGHTPATASDVVTRPARRPAPPRLDPESWSITA